MKTIKQSLLMFTVLTILLCGVYPAVVMGVSKFFFSEQSKGGLITHKGNLIGAELIAQEFLSDKYFWGRPSAAGYNASASSGSNYALINSDHQKAVNDRKAKGMDYDLLTTSGSGLDPHITPKAALLQVERIAKVRNMNPDDVTKLVQKSIEERQLGFLGEERVNVLKLNIALENLSHE